MLARHGSGSLPVHPTFTRGILASARATAEPMGARCLPDSSSSLTARTPSSWPASGRLPWDTCLNRPPKGSLPGTTGGAPSGFPTLSLEIGADSIIDPRGDGPRIWFRVEPDAKVVKNRLHLDIRASGGRSVVDRNVPLATRKQRVDAEARRLADLGATITGALSADGLDHYAMGMKDPEGNEFDIN